MTKRARHSNTFAVCIDNAGYRASLETGKLYRVIPDKKGEEHGLLRVVDETGEDYGYAAERFFILPLPLALEKVLAKQKPLATKIPMRREYDFRNGVRGKHASHFATGPQKPSK